VNVKLSHQIQYRILTDRNSPGTSPYDMWPRTCVTSRSTTATSLQFERCLALVQVKSVKIFLSNTCRYVGVGGIVPLIINLDGDKSLASRPVSFLSGERARTSI